jgi:hypothetical protein
VGKNGRRAGGIAARQPMMARTARHIAALARRGCRIIHLVHPGACRQLTPARAGVAPTTTARAVIHSR